MSSVQQLSERIGLPDGVRRLGQALWMMVGRDVRPNELLWVRGLLGNDGDQLLWNALVEIGALTVPGSNLEPIPVARLLCMLWRTDELNGERSRLVWTLPHQLGMPERESSYAQAAQAE